MATRKTCTIKKMTKPQMAKVMMVLHALEIHLATRHAVGVGAVLVMARLTSRSGVEVGSPVEEYGGADKAWAASLGDGVG